MKFFLIIVSVFFSIFLIGIVSAGNFNGLEFGIYTPNQTLLWDNFSRSDSGTIGNAYIPNTNWIEGEDATGVCGIKNFIANCTLSTADNNYAYIEHNWSNVNLTAKDIVVFQMNFSLQGTDDEWNFAVWELNKSLVNGRFASNGTFQYTNGSTPNYISVGNVISMNTWYTFKAEFNRTTNFTNYYLGNTPLALNVDTAANVVVGTNTKVKLGGWTGTSGSFDVALWDYVFLGTLTQSLINSNQYNTTITETEGTSFITNVSIDSSLIASANLIWSGTTYAGTVTNLGNSNSLLTRNIQVPTGTGLKNWYWNIIYTNGSEISTNNLAQSVSLLNLSICGASPQNIPFMNFTFKNETTNQESISAALSSEWTYYLGDGSVTKTLSYSNTGTARSYAFCGIPSQRTIYSSPVVTYSNPSALQRGYSPGVLALTNNSYNVTLWLLPTVSGQYVTFQVINGAQQVLSGVQIQINRSSYGIIETRTTDSAGTATFFLNPDITYLVTASLTGYPTFSQSIAPSQSSYTITLGTTSTSTNVTDYNLGMKFGILPANATLLNNTYYLFSLNLTSTYWDVTSYGFFLYNQTGGIVGSNSASTNGGVLTYNLSTGNYTSIRMNYFWVINGTYTNSSRLWIIFDNSDTSFGLGQFFSDLKLFLTDTDGDGKGIFGITSFTLNILIFLIILTAGGIVAFKFRYDNILVIVGVMAALTIFFDVSGLISYWDGAPNVPLATIIMVIAVIAIGIQEATR